MVINRAYIKLDNKKYFSLIEDALNEYFPEIEIELINDIAMVSTSNNDSFVLQLTKLHHSIMLDLNTNVSILVVPFFDKIFVKYLNYISNDVYTIFEVFLKNINDKTIKEDSKKILQSIDKKDVDTIKAFLMCNANSCATANELYLHRNSFNYRMNSFINNTSMDIRDINTLMFIQLILCINK